MAKQDTMITRKEPYGPIRLGLQETSEALGAQNGGKVFEKALDLANHGIDVVLDCHDLHGLGDPNISIPPPFHSVRILYRERGVGTSSLEQDPANEKIARL